MNEVQVKNFMGQIIGFIRTETDGRQFASPFIGPAFAIYWPKYDRTTDINGMEICSGNALVGLIQQRAAEQ